MIAPSLLEEATRLALSFQRPLLVSHRNPDGDALGSLVATRNVLTGAGAQPTALLFEPLPETYAVFRRHGPFTVLNEAQRQEQIGDCDGVIVLDTCTYSQLEPVAEFLRNTPIPILAVDHHVNRDALTEHTLIDESAAATCLILLDWFRFAGWRIGTDTGMALFVGLATDTGWFRYSNVDALALQAAADLTRQGVQAHRLYQELYQRDTASRVRLLGRALSSLELLCEDRVAVQTLRAEDLRAVKASSADTEGIVNEPLRIASVAASVILIAYDEGPIRISLRSKPPLADGDVDVDVSQVAQALGGGGHRRAAAARIPGTLDDVRVQVLHCLEHTIRRGCDD